MANGHFRNPLNTYTMFYFLNSRLYTGFSPNANFITVIFQKIPQICLMRSTDANFWRFYFISAIFGLYLANANFG